MEDDPLQFVVCSVCNFEVTGEARPAEDEFDEWQRAGFGPTQLRQWRRKGFTPSSASRWAKRQLTPTQAKSWESLGYQPSDIDDWLAAGFSIQSATIWNEWTPESARGWINAGFSSKEADLWSRWDICLADEAAELRKRIGEPPDELFCDLDIPIELAAAWQAAGFQAQWPSRRTYVEPYAVAGLSVDQATRILDYLAQADEDNGGDQDDCSELGDCPNVDDVAQLSEILKAGFGLTTSNVSAWRGMSASEILDAVDRGFGNAAQYETAKDTTLDADEVKAALARYGLEEDQRHLLSYRIQGFSLDESEAWLSTEIRPQEASKWAKAGFTSADACVYEEMGLSWKEARAWVAAGAQTPYEARRWVSAGWVPETAGPWLSHGIGLGAASDWHELDVEAAVANDWIQQGFTASSAARWILARVEPKAARRRAAAGLEPPSPPR